MTHIALFGGTFDPPHLAHEQLVAAACRLTGADQTWVMVNPAPPYRQLPLFTPTQRLALARAAFSKSPAVRILNFEFPLPVASYTVDTLTRLHERFPQHRFSLLLGSDQAALFPTWKAPATILQLATLVIVARPGYPLPKSELFTPFAPAPGAIRFAPFMPLPSLSSTAIRADLLNHILPAQSLSPAVIQRLGGFGNCQPHLKISEDYPLFAPFLV